MKLLGNLVAALLLFGSVCPDAHAETVFTYQGKLGSAGQPANGAHDFRFRLFDAETGGTQAGSQLTISPVSVDSGIFTVQLDFGDAPFSSNPRWLEIDVRAAGGGAYTTLAPRQRVGTSPFAIETLFVAPGAVDTAALQDNAVTTNKIADGNVFTNDLANFAVSTGKLSNQAVTRLKIADDSIGTAQIENNTVTSSDIRDATIQSVDLADVFLHDKAQILVVSASMSVPAGNLRSPSASCSDENDIPLSSACTAPASTTINLRSTANENWSSNSTAASTTCIFHNVGTSSITVTTSIYCLSVP